METDDKAAHRAVASAGRLPTLHPCAGPLRTKSPCLVAGAWHLHTADREIPDYVSSLNLITEVLDFVQLGGPSVTVLQTFEWVVPL